jgi:hypothetical protein
MNCTVYIPMLSFQAHDSLLVFGLRIFRSRPRKIILGSNTQVKNAIRVSPEKDYCSCKRLGYNFSSHMDVIFATSLIRGLVLRLHKFILASRYLDANSASSLKFVDRRAGAEAK